MSGRAGARRGTPEAWFTFVVLALCVVAVVTMYARGGRTSVGVVVAAGLPFVLLVAIAAALLPWWHHPRWRLALVGALLLSQAPLLDHVVPDRAPAPTGSQTIRVATLNTLHSRPTDAALVELAQDVDVLALQEWSASRTRGLTAALGPDWQLVASDNDDYIAAQVAVWVRRSWTVLEAPHLPGRQPGRAVRLERDGAWAVARVSDSGPGIAPEQLALVFDHSFHDGRLAHAGSRGLGLGLTVVRHLVEAHGGAVEATSPGPGQGTTMVVRLPLRAG